MKRIAYLILLLGFSFVPAVHAQNHGEVGAFADYFRLGQPQTNFAGVGGRVSLNVAPRFQLEGEMAYDFERAFTEGFTDPSTGSVTLQKSHLRILHGLFGPKLQTSGPVRLFVTVKGGFINFRFDNRPATFATFTSSVQDLRSNNVSGVLYPGGGVEGFLGPIGLRLDVGDEIFFANGSHHNLRVSFGPHIRF